jgi:heterotetrameric sarcosine oxidase delta subunit
MSRLHCPFCGPREREEFRFHKTVGESGADAYQAAYLRTTSTSVSLEHWQHVHGCHAWLLVKRNPTDNSVLEVMLAGGGGPMETAHDR